MSKIIGIDLGTSIRRGSDGRRKGTVSLPRGTPWEERFPSYLAFTKDEQLLVGEPAQAAVTNPKARSLRSNVRWDRTTNIRCMVKSSRRNSCPRSFCRK